MVTNNLYIWYQRTKLPKGYPMGDEIFLKRPETIHIGEKWDRFNHFDPNLNFPPNDLSYLKLNGLDESYYEVAKLNIVNSKGVSMSENKYFALRFGKFDDALFNFPFESKKRAAGLRDRFLYPDLELKTAKDNKNIFVLLEFCYMDCFILNAEGVNYVIDNFYCEIYNATDFPFVFNNQYKWDILPYDNEFRIKINKKSTILFRKK